MLRPLKSIKTPMRFLIYVIVISMIISSHFLAYEISLISYECTHHYWIGIEDNHFLHFWWDFALFKLVKTAETFRAKTLGNVFNFFFVFSLKSGYEWKLWKSINLQIIHLNLCFRHRTVCATKVFNINFDDIKTAHTKKKPIATQIWIAKKVLQYTDSTDKKYFFFSLCF